MATVRASWPGQSQMHTLVVYTLNEFTSIYRVPAQSCDVPPPVAHRLEVEVSGGDDGVSAHKETKLKGSGGCGESSPPPPPLPVAVPISTALQEHK